MTYYLTENDLSESERYFAENVGKPPLTNEEKAKAFLGQKQQGQRPPNREQCKANLSKLSEMVGAAVDDAMKKRS